MNEEIGFDRHNFVKRAKAFDHVIFASCARRIVLQKGFGYGHLVSGTLNPVLKILRVFVKKIINANDAKALYIVTEAFYDFMKIIDCPLPYDMEDEQLLLYPANEILLLYPSKQEKQRLHHNEWMREWRKKNPDKLKITVNKYNNSHRESIAKRKSIYASTRKDKNKQYMKKWYEEHASESKEKAKIYAKEHAEQRNEQCKQWHLLHPGKQSQYAAKWYSENAEHARKQQSEYSKTPLGKIRTAKQNSRRKREMGFDMLNDWFKGCEMHHINADQIVCIPKELHKLYRHNHKKPETMIEINRIAMQYIFNCKT